VILLLGGTAEARELAAGLVADGVPVVTSLAGRVARPRLPAGEVRIGGFGGPKALAAWLTAHGVSAVVDATHPFAQRISDSAAGACERAGVPLLRLERPGWTEQSGDRWIWVDDLAGAADAIVRERGRQVFLTTGRQGLDAFAHLSQPWFLIRCVDPPAVALPARHRVVLDRGPYTLSGEGALLDRHAIDLVVTKDSGGDLTRAKLDAARARGVPVVVVRRPPRRATGTVTTVQQAHEWARAHG
jgi:precorrin-6A/cobalt-precorrin-6A reductase